MIYLILAILTSSLILITFKIFDKYRISLFQTITINYFVAALVGYSSIFKEYPVSVIISSSWFFLAILTGMTLILTFLVFGISSQKAGISVTAIASKMSVIIPVISGFLFFYEEILWVKIVGIVLAMAAFVLCLKKDNSSTPLKYAILPLLLFFGNGMNDTLLKTAQSLYLKDNAFVAFLCTAFIFSLLIGIGILLAKKEMKFSGKSILGGVWLGILNWYSTYFFIVGLSYFDVSVFIPLFNVSIVVLAAISGFVLFKERLKLLNWIGVIIAITAILLLTL